MEEARLQIALGQSRFGRGAEMCRRVSLLVVILLLGAACSGDSQDASAPPASTTTTTTASVALTTTTTTPATTTSITAAPATPTTTTTISTTTTTSSPATTAPATTAPATTTTVVAVPPMQCSLGSDLDPEDCYYWGYVVAVDATVRTLDLDLVLIETGESDFEIINNNPLIRTLPLADDVTVAACPTDPGSTVPNECGNPEFDEFPLSELATWVANGYDFWGLVLDNDEVALIQQWWWP